MISISRFLNRSPEKASVDSVCSQAAAGFVESIVEAVSNSAINYDEIRYREFQDQLATLAGQLSSAATPEDYSPLVGRLAEVILDNRRGTEKFFRDLKDELRSIVDLITRSISVLGADESESIEKLKDLSRDFDRVQTARDVAEFKNRFRKSLDEVQKSAESRRRKMAAEMSEIKRELAQSQQRLQEFQIDPGTDAVTGLPTRDEAVESLFDLSERDAISFVFALTMQQLSVINAKYGHQAGNAILKGFSDNLQSRMGRSGRMFRWSGNCFIAIFSKDDVPQEQGGDMVRKLAANVTLEVESEGKTISIPICPKWLCLGRTETIPAPLLIERIDRFTADLF